MDAEDRAILDDLAKRLVAADRLTHELALSLLTTAYQQGVMAAVDAATDEETLP